MLNLAEKKRDRLALQESLATSVEASGAPRVEEQPQETNAVSALVEHLSHLGVEQAFGVSGGAIALLFDALIDSDIQLHHFRHETGAAFAATEAHFASGKPSVVFATTGPGMMNALTGMTAGRWDGAKVILVTGSTNHAQRGRWATQETSSYTLPQDGIYSQGAIFDYAVRMEHASELPQVVRRLSQGVARPGRFVAHVSMPIGVQSARVDLAPQRPRFRASAPSVAVSEVEHIAQLLKGDSFAIWAGYGATQASDRVRQLAEASGAMVFCSPRAKGVMPELHAQYLGVTGLGGHGAVTDYMQQNRPRHILVLGSRLGEATSFWDRDMIPSGSFIHVDIDPEVPGTSYPDAETYAVHGEVDDFLKQLLKHFPARRQPAAEARRNARPTPLPIRDRRPVRPQVLMSGLQRKVIQGTEAVVLAECGNSFAWCNHYLRFPTAGRYRVSTLFGSMGHAATGVVGTALAKGDKAVAVVGDGSMLMNCEISSAVQYGAAAVWIVLNDSGYGMCRDGHQALGLTGEDIHFPRVDFAEYAKAQGADGVKVETEDQLDRALDLAMASSRPFVVDVHVDPNESSPLLERFDSLIKQGSSKNIAGWDARD